jgi:hypothetical protein
MPDVKPKMSSIELMSDGNAFAILGKAQRAARKVWTADEWKEFQTEATSGDYDHLIQCVLGHFDIN